MFQILKGDLKAAPKAWVPGQERRVEEVREQRGEHAKKLAVQDALGLRDLDKVKGDLRKTTRELDGFRADVVTLREKLDTERVIRMTLRENLEKADARVTQLVKDNGDAQERVSQLLKQNGDLRVALQRVSPNAPELLVGSAWAAPAVAATPKGESAKGKGKG